MSEFLPADFGKNDSDFLKKPVSLAGKLDDAERAQWARYNASVTDITPEFKAWLTNFILVEVARQLPGGGSGGGSLGRLPPGVILPYGGNVSPAGGLLCDGASYLRSSYPDLFTAIDVRYGSVDGAHFNVPDLRERIPVGKGTITAHDTLGKSDGRAIGTRGTSHSHDVTVSVGGATDSAGNHGHTYRAHTEVQTIIRQGTAGPDEAVGLSGGFDASTGGAGAHSHGISGSGSGTTTGAAQKNSPGFLTIDFVIVT